MKILKILLIILVPALGIVGCKKSESHPDCATSNTKPAEGKAAVEPTSDTQNYSARGVDEDDEIFGSGDDDRNGGDKKAKRKDSK